VAEWVPPTLTRYQQFRAVLDKGTVRVRAYSYYGSTAHQAPSKPKHPVPHSSARLGVPRPL